MLVASVLSLTPKWQRYGTFTIGLYFLLAFVVIHIPKLLTDLHNGGEWTVAFETLALACGAFIIFETNAVGGKVPSINGFIKWAAYYLFAVSLIVFGCLHVVYLDFIVTLIPAWLPGKLLFAYLVLAAFFAAAISLILKARVRLAMQLLSLMFLIWVLILHLPRVVLNSQVEAEWASMFIALGMSGIALVIAMHVHSLALGNETDALGNHGFKAETELK